MGLLGDSWKVDALAIFLGTYVVLHLLIKRTYSYWDRRGFKTLPNFNYFLGHFSPMLAQNVSLTDMVAKLYENTKEPFIGVYEICRPILLARCPQIVRSIMVKDSAHFLSRGFHSNDNFDPMLGQCFALPAANKWKEVRGKLTPAFTSSKLKAIFPILVDNGTKLQQHLHKLANNGEILNLHDIAARYATNTIASAGFGIDVDTIKNPENDFRKIGRKIFEPSLSNRVRLILGLSAPAMMNVFGGNAIDNNAKGFIKTLVKENAECREHNNINRKDFFEQLTQLNNNTTQNSDQLKTDTLNNKQGTMTEDEIAAQALLFLAAGFEQAAITITFCLYELAKEQIIQKRVQDEMVNVLQQHNGRFTYESISNMKYLDACIDGKIKCCV